MITNTIRYPKLTNEVTKYANLVKDLVDALSWSSNPVVL